VLTTLARSHTVTHTIPILPRLSNATKREPEIFFPFFSPNFSSRNLLGHATQYPSPSCARLRFAAEGSKQKHVIAIAKRMPGCRPDGADHVTERQKTPPEILLQRYLGTRRSNSPLISIKFRNAAGAHKRCWIGCSRAASLDVREEMYLDALSDLVATLRRRPLSD